MKDQELMPLLFVDAAEFRDELLATTLRSVRRRRRVRRLGQGLAIAALFATVLWWSVPPRSTVIAPSASTTPMVKVVYTQPLPPDRIVTSSQASVAIVPTDSATLAFVGDEELLDLVPGETKLLVWHAPHQAELVILGP